MKHKIYITPVSLYHRAAIQEWLTEKMEEGLFPTKIGRFISIFTKNTDGICEFYLEPRGEKENAVEDLQTHPSNDWTYVCPVYHTFFLFSGKRNTPKPDSTAKLHDIFEGWTEQIKKEISWGGTITPILIAFVIVVTILLFMDSKYDVQPNRFAQLPRQMLMLLNPFCVGVFLIAIVMQICRYIEGQCLTRYGEQAIPPRQKSMRWRNALLLVVSMISVVSGLIPILQTKEQPLIGATESYIQLSAIEDVQLATLDELYEYDGNYVERISTILASEAYLVYQESYEIESDAERTSTAQRAHDYMPSLDTAYFQFLFSALSRPMAETQMDSMRIVNLRWNYTEMEYEGLDFVIFAEEEKQVVVSRQMLAIGKGNRVAVFSYYGAESLEEHLDTLSEQVLT